MKENVDVPVFQKGRVTTLNAEQEIALKQIWAYFLKYLGYEISLSLDEIKYKECYVSSNTFNHTQGGIELERKESMSSMVSGSSRSSSNGTGKSKNSRKRFFGVKAPKKISQLNKNSPRLVQLNNDSISETYEELVNRTDNYEEVFNYYICSSKMADSSSLGESDDLSDTESIESFVTAMSSIPADGYSYSYSSPQSKVSLTSLLKIWKGKPSKNNFFRPYTDLLPNSSKLKPVDVHSFLFEGLGIELLDNFVLRFIRARKLDTKKTLEMLVNTIHWKTEGFGAIDLLRKGDAQFYIDNTNHGVKNNLIAEKAFIGGYDKRGNPLFVFQSRKHDPSVSSLEDTKKYAILCMEWMSVYRNRDGFTDQYSVVFDLTGFSTKNIDNPPIKFLTEVLEAHYPEVLGVIIVHNAPWIFSMVWNIIKNWIDPEVASKIHFTKDLEELQEFIDKDNIPEYLGGKNKAPSKYVVPTEQHTTPPLKKDFKYHTLMRERERLFLAYLKATKRWIESVKPDISAKFLQAKINISIELAKMYPKLDPYIRNPGVFDRNNSLSWERNNN